MIFQAMILSIIILQIVDIRTVDGKIEGPMIQIFGSFPTNLKKED